MATVTVPPALKSRYRRITSVLLVDRIEPCLEFWVERLGFEVRLQVQGEGGLNFVVLGHEDVEILFRTRASLQQGSPGLFDGGTHSPWVVLYVQVADLDEILPRLEGIEVVVPLRETILGTREIYVREPSGRVVALCEDR